MPELTSCLQNAYEFLRFTQVSGGASHTLAVQTWLLLRALLDASVAF